MILQETWQIGKIYYSKVNFKKLIKDFREQFPYDPLTALIVETVANSLDANATEINIYISDGIYKILDNGTGMTEEQFREYHNIASLTKEKGKGGIGFAGIGAKIYLDKAEYVITETKSKSFNGATIWKLDSQGNPIYKAIQVKGKIPYETGTYIEVKIKDYEEIKKLNFEFVESIIKKYYNSVLLGYYKRKYINIDGIRINPWFVKKDEIEFKKHIRIQFKYKDRVYKIKGILIKSKRTVPEEFQGISIVVHGKTVMSYWFKQVPLEPEKFTGYIIADDLIEILTTSKSDFNRESGLWKVFHRKMSEEIGKWLDQIKAKPKIPAKAFLEDTIRNLEKTLNRLLKMPEFSELANITFQRKIKRDVSIKSKFGEQIGKFVNGAQKVPGTLGGPGIGGGVKTIGDKEGIGVKEGGDEARIKRVRRTVRSGLKIGFEYQPDNPSEGWLTESAVIINVATPTWKIAFAMSLYATYDDIIIYHILRVVTKVLVEEADIQVQDKSRVFMQFLDAWYQKNIPKKIRSNVDKLIILEGD